MEMGRVYGIVEQQKSDVVLSVSFGTNVFYSEALGLGLEREDVDADGRILFLKYGNLFCFHRVINAGHVQCRLVSQVVGDAFLM